jgi:small conductance mechanosensitive channel
VDWTFGVEYGSDFNHVESVLREIIAADKRILTDTAPFIALQELDASSVNIVVRCWVKPADYWDVYFDMQKNVYRIFNEKGIGFPFPQLTVHQG